MFKSKIKSETLREIVDVVSTLVDDAKFNITKKGMGTKAVDPAHVAMVEVSVDKNAFEEFKATDTEIGIDIDKLREALKLSKSGDVIAMEYDEDKNRLVLNINNITRRMALVDTAGMSDPKVPNLTLPVKLTINVSELRQGIRAAESVSDHVALKATPEGFEMSSEGETDSFSLKVPKDLLTELECKESAKSLFSLDYFANMVKSVGSSQTVTLYLGSDYPVNMDFDLADGKGNVKYLLAPRIESD